MEISINSDFFTTMEVLINWIEEKSKKYGDVWYEIEGDYYHVSLCDIRFYSKEEFYLIFGVKEIESGEFFTQSAKLHPFANGDVKITFDMTEGRVKHIEKIIDILADKIMSKQIKQKEGEQNGERVRVWFWLHKGVERR